MIRQMRLHPNGNAPIVMFVTSNGLGARLNAIRELGVTHYVVKPVKRRELYAAISEARAEFAAPAHPAAAPRNEIALNGLGKHLLDRPLSILLADDSPDNRLLIAAYLKKSGYVLDEVEDGQLALDHFMTRTYDLVLMDIQMPVLDGYSAVRLIRQWESDNQRGRTPIIALSAAGTRSGRAPRDSGWLRYARQQAGQEVDAAQGNRRNGRGGRKGGYGACGESGCRGTCLNVEPAVGSTPPSAGVTPAPSTNRKMARTPFCSQVLFRRPRWGSCVYLNGAGCL